jgi:hypothetical protein
MVCLNTGSRSRTSEMVAAIAALPVLVLAQFSFAAPASAHHLYRHHVAHDRADRMMTGDASPGFTWQNSSNAGLYNYAAAYQEQGGRRVRTSRSAFNNSGWGAGPSYQSYGNRGGASPEIDGNIGGNIGGMASSAAGSSGVPASLIARVIKRESGGNPRAVSKGNYGLMQIRLGTARAMGYTGSAEGLLDPQTNMTYAVKYLAGAYRAAGGNEDRAVALYARGYHDVAKAQGVSSYQRVADAGFGNSDFGLTPGRQFGGRDAYGFNEGAPAYRGRHHRRRGEG